MKTALRVTPAPQVYDAECATETVMMLDEKTRSGKNWRLVAIREDWLEWQRNRNASGGYPTVTVEEFDEWRSLGIA